MIATLTPDQVAARPGQLEATAIEFDNEQAMKGRRHYVLMGLRLMDVKARLPHGQFIPWLETHLPTISKPHLHRAKSIAQGLCDMTGVKFIARDKFEAFATELPPELEMIVDGASGYRALMAEIQEFRSDHDEETAKAKCAALFAQDAELRDEWEPRALSGEMSWTLVLRGIAGQVATKGGKRSEPDYASLVPRSLTTIRNGFAKWEAMSEDARIATATEFRKLFAAMPDDLRRSLNL